MNEAVAAELAAEAGMDQALHAERVAVWKTRAGDWLDEQPEGLLFTADDLVAAIGLPDSGVARNNAVGAWISAQSQAGRIEFSGEFRKSRRVEGHGNLQRLWRVREGMEEVPAGFPPSRPDASSTSSRAGVADAPPGGAPDVPVQPSLLDGIKARYPELFTEAA